MADVNSDTTDSFQTWHLSVKTLVDRLNGKFPDKSLWEFDSLVREFADAASDLPADRRKQPLCSIGDVVDIFKACANGMEITVARRFTAVGAARRGLLDFYTSVPTPEEFNCLFVNPLLDYYEEHPNLCPKRTLDVSVENRVFGRFRCCTRECLYLSSTHTSSRLPGLSTSHRSILAMPTISVF